ncbi:hypothetical protein DUI87_21407 [Hirundo rustica rustica]|uniref:Uncharacterized protein n=1 Tax=Hirundo rustica rustica TaxID=333673 RepID=A0A3M0JU18_HIRRU|nr:hypothetical protein DUI87_21407 [Hirundo rustica rustica]
MRTRQDEKENVDCPWFWHEPGFVQAQNTSGTELFSEPSKKTFNSARNEGEVVNQELLQWSLRSNDPFALEAGITGSLCSTELPGVCQGARQSQAQIHPSGVCQLNGRSGGEAADSFGIAGFSPALCGSASPAAEAASAGISHLG